jgi:acyl-CoA synthetase (AMP-forming)/AMP-acid ligase II
MERWHEQFARHGEAPALTVAQSTGKRAVEWSYSDIAGHVSHVSSCLRTARASRVVPREGGCRHAAVETSCHILICGGNTLQAVSALACWQERIVGVFVPVEKANGAVLQSLLLAQRATEACAIIVDDRTWSSIQTLAQTR